jgi:hypothetical protein
MKPDSFHGSGQGAGDSMSRWGFVSDAIIRAYNRTAISDRISGPISQLQTTEIIQAFLDDSHGIVIRNPNSDKSIEELIQHNMQTWGDLLHAAGGKLEISKCKYVLFNSQTQAPPGASISTTSISITDQENGQMIPLDEITTADHYKLLGIQMAFDGNQQGQDRAMNKKCQTFANTFMRCHLTPDKTYLGYRTIFLPTVLYGLSATTISEKNLNKSQQIITSILLSKLGFNRHTPRAIAFAPTHFGGIGLYNLHVEQGLAHMLFFIGHMRAKNDTTKILSILLESYMIAAGTTVSPFLDTKARPYLHAPWIDILREFIYNIEMTITTPTILCPKLIRDHDFAIMDIDGNVFSNKKDLMVLNKCRTWLQVTTVAEISNIEGTAILPAALKYQPDRENTPELW